MTGIVEQTIFLNEPVSDGVWMGVPETVSLIDRVEVLPLGEERRLRVFGEFAESGTNFVMRVDHNSDLGVALLGAARLSLRAI